MNTSRITCAIWPWGTEKREEMEVAAKEITEIGYETFESVKSAIYAYNLDLNAYKEVLKRYSLKPVSFYFHFPTKGNEKELFGNLEKELEFVAALDVKRLSLQATRNRPEEPSKQSNEYELEQIIKFAEIAKSFGITTCLHPHHNTWVMLESEIDYMLQNTDRELLSFGPDTAHLVAGDCDPVEVIRKYADRVKFIHLKDFKLGENIGSEGLASAGMEVYSNFAELGAGDVNFREVFDVLKGVNYDGYLCIELDKAPVSNAQSARKNFEFVKNNY